MVCTWLALRTAEQPYSEMDNNFWPRWLRAVLRLVRDVREAGAPRETSSRFRFQILILIVVSRRRLRGRIRGRGAAGQGGDDVRAQGPDVGLRVEEVEEGADVEDEHAGLQEVGADVDVGGGSWVGSGGGGGCAACGGRGS